MQQVILVTLPALLGAAGTVISAYIAQKLRRVEKQTDGRLTHVESELQLTRLLLADTQRRLNIELEAGRRPPPRLVE